MSGTRSATTALCPVTANASWPPWMVTVVGIDHHRVAGTLVGVELAMRGLALEAPVESTLETPSVCRRRYHQMP